MSRPRWLACWLASLVAVYWISGRLVGGRSPVVAPAPAAQPARTGERVHTQLAPTLASTSEPSALTSPPRRELFERAVATLERDLVDGRWSADDRDRLADVMPRLTADEAEQVVTMLFPRLNSGAVIAEFVGPPL